MAKDTKDSKKGVSKAEVKKDIAKGVKKFEKWDKVQDRKDMKSALKKSKKDCK